MIPPQFIDIHHHIYPPAFTRRNLDRIIADAPSFPSATYLDWTPEVSLEIMDKHGIARAITSITSPGIWLGDAAAAKANARECNEYGAGVIAAHPARFGMFAAIPLPDTGTSLREIEYALDVLKLDGIGLMTSYDGKLLGDPLFAPVFDELDRRKAAVFVHPLANGGAAAVDNPWLTPPILEFPFDTTRTIMSLLLSGTFVRHPGIRFVFCHGGGPISFMLGRLEGAVAQIYTEAQRAAICPAGLRSILQTLHFDVVSVANPGAWPSVSQMADGQRLLFGTDTPFVPAAVTLRDLQALSLEGAGRAQIMQANAARLLGQPA